MTAYKSPTIDLGWADRLEVETRSVETHLTSPDDLSQFVYRVAGPRVILTRVWQGLVLPPVLMDRGEARRHAREMRVNQGWRWTGHHPLT